MIVNANTLFFWFDELVESWLGTELHMGTSNKSHDCRVLLFTETMSSN